MSSALQKKIYKITITKDNNEGGFIGRCDELHANSQGETYGEIMENMKEAVELAAKGLGNKHDFDILISQKTNE